MTVKCNRLALNECDIALQLTELHATKQKKESEKKKQNQKIRLFKRNNFIYFICLIFFYNCKACDELFTYLR